MTWTYSGDPGSSDLDEVRFLVGDTKGEEPHSLSDEEITFLLRDDTSTLDAAIQVAEQMGRFFTKLSVSTKKVGDLWLQQNQAATAGQFYQLADRLRESKGSRMGAFPFLDTTPKIFAVGADDYIAES